MWLASGGLQEIGSVESSANDISPPMILSPSKQWVWWLGGPLPRSLVTLEMDPVTGAAVQLNERIDLPPGASQFVATPDGEHILVLDPDAEQLLLHE